MPMPIRATASRLPGLVTLLLLATPSHAQTAAIGLPTAPTQTLLVAADHSLTTAQYAALGLPPPTRPWSDGELARAVTALQKLAERDPLKLPRLESAASGEVFARLVAPIALPADVTRSDSRTQIAALSGFAPSLGTLAVLYSKPAAGDFCFDAELVETTRAALELNSRLLQLINRARSAQGEKPAPDWLRRADDQVVYGAALTVRGALFIFSARRAFRPEWSGRLGKALHMWVPKIMEQLPEPAHAAILTHLHGLMMEDPKGYPDWQPVQEVMTFVGHGPPAFPPRAKPAKRHRKKKPE